MIRWVEREVIERPEMRSENGLFTLPAIKQEVKILQYFEPKLPGWIDVPTVKDGEE